MAKEILSHCYYLQTSRSWSVSCPMSWKQEGCGLSIFHAPLALFSFPPLQSLWERKEDETKNRK